MGLSRKLDIYQKGLNQIEKFYTKPCRGMKSVKSTNIITQEVNIFRNMREAYTFFKLKEHLFRKIIRSPQPILGDCYLEIINNSVDSLQHGCR